MDGREERCTEGELPNNLPYHALISDAGSLNEHIRQLLKKAYKYSDEPIPEGLLKEGETL